MIIKIYQRFLSPPLHRLSAICYSPFAGCRFHPTCSEYFATAVAKYGIIHGGFLGLRRLLKCHPYSTAPLHDPVPKNLKS